VIGRVEQLKLVNAALPAQNLLPQFVNLAAQRSDGANPGNDYATFHGNSKQAETVNRK
jgi:hypothetical protein